MIDVKAIVEDSGILLLVARMDGRVLYRNGTAADWLGLSQETPVRVWDLAERETVERLFAAVQKFDSRRPADGKFSSRTEKITLRRGDGTFIDLTAIVSPMHDGDEGTLLRICAFDDGANRAYIEELERLTDFLNGFTDASTEAMWCMEYTEPVDLTAGESEIVRQVFENDCHWTMCNRAMARLYGLPEDLDFNRQRVSSYFRRNPENEAFVRQLIDSNFHVDSAPSTDLRHDGTLVYVENSVRCRIEGGKIYRMWGTVRDTTEFHTEHNRIAQRERQVREILNALPDAILVINKSRRVLAINPAFELTFGWRAENVLDKDVSQFIELDSTESGGRRWFAGKEHRWPARVAQPNGKFVTCDVRIAPLQDDENRRFVLSMRPDLTKAPVQARVGTVRQRSPKWSSARK